LVPLTQFVTFQRSKLLFIYYLFLLLFPFGFLFYSSAFRVVVIQFYT